MSATISIGQMAKRAGVSVQTLRHYDKLGLLRPSEVTPAGYRRYSEADYARLELVRTLRAVGFDLDTIARLLKNQLRISEAVRLQIDAIEVQKRSLQRQQAVLKAVAEGEESAVLARLRRLDALARLDRLEREAFLAAQLRPAMAGKPVDMDVWRAATADLPVDMSEAQVEVWLELAEIASDPDFLDTLKRQGQPPTDGALNDEAWRAWGAASQCAMTRAAEAVRAGHAPDSAEAQAEIAAWMRDCARVLGRKPDRAFARWMLAYFESNHHPKIDRYWQLVAQLKDRPYSPIHAQAFHWLMAGLQSVAARATAAKRGSR